MPAYSITSVPCNEIHLRSRRVVKPLVIEDVPSSVTEARMNQQYPSNTSIPIIEDAENLTQILVETQEETIIETQAT